MFARDPAGVGGRHHPSAPAAAGAGGPATGRVTTKLLPSPTTECARMAPRCRSMMRRQTASPMPVLAPPIPQHPFLAPNGKSNIHDDAYMSDTYETGGPLGRAPQVFSAFLGTMDEPQALPISMAFDRYGRILLIPVGANSARLMWRRPIRCPRLQR